MLVRKETDGSVSIIGVKIYTIYNSDNEKGFIAKPINSADFIYYEGIRIDELNIIFKNEGKSSFNNLSLKKEDLVEIKNITLNNFGQRGNKIYGGTWTIYNSNFGEIEKFSNQDQENASKVFDVISRGRTSYNGNNLAEINKSIQELEEIEKNQHDLFGIYEGKETLDLLESKKLALELGSENNPPNSTPTNSNSYSTNTPNQTPPSNNPPNDEPNNPKTKDSLANRIKELENKPHKTSDEEEELKSKKEELERLNKQAPHTQNDKPNNWLPPVLIIGGSAIVAGLITFLIFRKKKITSS